MKIKHSPTIDLDDILVDLHLTMDALSVPPPRNILDNRKEKLRRQDDLLVSYFLVYSISYDLHLFLPAPSVGDLPSAESGEHRCVSSSAADVRRSDSDHPGSGAWAASAGEDVVPEG